MEVFTQLPFNPGPEFPAAGGIMLLVFALIDFRRKNRFEARLVAGLILLAIAWTPLRGWFHGLGFMTLWTLAIGIDLWNDKRLTKGIRRVTAVGFCALTALSIHFHIRDRATLQKLTLTDSSLSSQVGNVGRSSLRVVEFGAAPGRIWHLKGGNGIISIDEHNTYATAADEKVGAAQIVDLIESWADVKRERKPREALVAAR